MHPPFRHLLRQRKNPYSLNHHWIHNHWNIVAWYRLLSSFGLKKSRLKAVPLIFWISVSPFEYLTDTDSDDIYQDPLRDNASYYRFLATLRPETPLGVLRQYIRISYQPCWKLPRIAQEEWQGLWVPRMRMDGKAYLRKAFISQEGLVSVLTYPIKARNRWCMGSKRMEGIICGTWFIGKVRFNNHNLQGINAPCITTLKFKGVI